MLKNLYDKVLLLFCVLFCGVKGVISIMINSSCSDPGIIKSNHTCQQLEAPELPEPTEADIPQVKAVSTFQLPFGASSAITELRLGNLKSIEAFILTVLNYRSNWVSGKTWKSSLRKLSELTGVSVRYIRKTIANLIESGWVSVLSIGTNTGSQYQVKHHNCRRSEIPTDKHGNPLKFAVPQGKGGILERLFDGDISWKSALIWIILKAHSDWKTGITRSISINMLRAWVGMSPQTVSDCLTELAKAGLLKRLSKNREKGVYQLYPKPDGKLKPVYRREKCKPKKNETRQMRIDGDWRLSFNELWRINVETGTIQTRKSRKQGLWRGLTLGDVIPKAIQEDFDFCVMVRRQVREAVTDTAHPVTDTAQGVTHTAPGLFTRLCESIASKGS